MAAPATSITIGVTTAHGVDDDPPLVLTRVSLSQPETSMAVALPSRVRVTDGEVPPLRLLLEGTGASTALRVARWLAGRAETVKVRRSAVSGGTMLQVRDGCRRGAVYVVDDGDAVGVTDPLLPAKCGQPLHPTLIPAATIDVTFIAPSASKVPPAGTLRLADCKRSSARRIADIPFAIAAGEARIRVPSDCSVPIFSAGDLTAVALPITPRAAAKVKLAPIRLERGAAILARVVSNGLPLDDVAVAAVPAEAANALRPRQSAEALAALANGVTQGGGWVKLTGIPSGRDLVLMLRDGKRRYPAFTAVYRPEARQPLLLDPLEMPPPASLTVRLDMPKDLLEHGVAALSVDAAAAAENPWPKHQSLNARVSNMTATFEEIPPGKWRVRALGRIAGSTIAELGAVQAEVTPGNDAIIDLPVRSHLYRGIVTLRGEPVRGDLTLRSPHGAQSTVRLGDDGRFAVILAEGGFVRADLRQRPGDGSIPYVVVPRVDFTSNEGEIVIALPEGRISGRVVDGDGNPVANATVSASGMQIGDAITTAEGGARSAADGTFTLDALCEARWAVEAQQGKRRTTPLDIALAPSQQVSGVKLILGATVTLSGQVTTPSGVPVDGVAVVLDRLGDAGFAGPLFARSGADGGFSLDIPEALVGQLVDVKLRARDGSVAAQRLTVKDPLLLQLPRTGALKLSTATAANPPLMTMFVAGDGSGVNTPFCKPQITESAQGRTLLIASLGAGNWRYVEARTAADVVRIIRGEAAMLPALATFSVQPGLTAEVDLRDKGSRGTP